MKEFPLHQRTRPLAAGLYSYLIRRYNGQMDGECLDSPMDTVPSLESQIPPEETDWTEEPHKEHSDRESFRLDLTLILHKSSVVPETRRNIFEEMMELVTTLCPFVNLNEPVEDRPK